MTGNSPDRYSRLQISLHWIIAALILLQFLAHDGIEHVWDAYEDGEAVATGDLPLAYLHVATGVSILLLVILRIYVRLTRGAPPLPEDHPAVLKFVAHANHFLLYAFLIAMPLTGATAWFLGVEDAAEIHEAGKTLLLILVTLHIAGGLAEHFFFRTNVLRRMLGLAG